MSAGARLLATPFGRLAVLALPAEDDAAALERLAEPLSKNQYGEYLRRVAREG